VQRQIAQNNKAAKMMEKLEGENSGASKPSPVVFNLSSGSLNKQVCMGLTGSDYDPGNSYAISCDLDFFPLGILGPFSKYDNKIQLML
jgi:hypothetical protein